MHTGEGNKEKDQTKRKASLMWLTFLGEYPHDIDQREDGLGLIPIF